MDVPAFASPVGAVGTVSRVAPVAHPVADPVAVLAARPGSQRERSTLTAAHVGLAVAAACSWSVKRGRAAVKGPKRVQMRPGCSEK